MKLDALKLIEDAFNTPRDPRSQPYKDGAYAVLLFKINGQKIKCPFEAGTSQSDAFFAGCQEGHSIFNRATEKAEA